MIKYLIPTKCLLKCIPVEFVEPLKSSMKEIEILIIARMTRVYFISCKVRFVVGKSPFCWCTWWSSVKILQRVIKKFDDVVSTS